MDRSVTVRELVLLSEKLLEMWDAAEDTENQLVLVEAFLKEREPLLQEITSDPLWLEAERQTDDMKRLQMLDTGIEHRIREMMTLMGGKIEEIKGERLGLLKKKQGNNGYLKAPVSAEGYFIDKKK